MRLPQSAHTSQPWRIHELTSDFELEDVWELPAVGARDAFPQLVHVMASFDPLQTSSCAVRALFLLRLRLGRILRWDSQDSDREAMSTLRRRMPADLRAAPAGPDFSALPFSSLYLLDNEWAAEVDSPLLHGVIHIGHIPTETGSRAQMAVLVKRHGVRGAAYMAMIRPFRYLVVYPRMLEEIGQRWSAAMNATSEPGVSP